MLYLSSLVFIRIAVRRGEGKVNKKRGPGSIQKAARCDEMRAPARHLNQIVIGMTTY